jgi:hypothetical protein
METPIFPQDFLRRPHPVVSNATMWTYPKTGKTVISIVGGGEGLYGNGVETFEMFDFRQEETQNYLLEEEINEHLKNNPI